MSKRNSSTFVGMDVHKKSIHVAILISDSSKTKEEFQISHDSKSVNKLIKKLKKLSIQSDLKSCYEAGPCGYKLQRDFRNRGLDCVVIAPSLIPVKPGERVKTDRRDARKLAQLFRSGMLTEVHPPSPEEESLRDLTRAREDLVQDRQRARHRLSKMLLRQGFIYREGNHWTQRHGYWIRSIQFEDKNAQKVFDSYRLGVEQIDERLKQLTDYLVEVSKEEPYAEPVSWLRCLRGVDTVTAMTVVAELHDFRRFVDPRHLMSYLGLTPSEYSSGTRVKRGSITKTGNGHVRRVLVESAWNYRHKPAVSTLLKRRRKDQPVEVIAIADRAQQRLHKKYFRMKEGHMKPHNVVTVAIARELVGFIWAILNHKQKAA